MQVFSYILRLLFPCYCLICKKQDSYLCGSCKKSLIPHPEICPSCHKASSDFVTCFSCKEQEKTHLSGCHIAFSYSQAIKKCIYALKFFHRYEISNFLASQIALQIQSNPKLSKNLKNTLITRVPSHWTRRYFQKGYNQSELLAKTTAKILNIPCSLITKKTKRTESQIHLSRKKRLQNLLGVFSAYTQTSINNDIHTIIIIDDITTTGSTLEQVAKVIKKQYMNKELRGCVVARHN